PGYRTDADDRAAAARLETVGEHAEDQCRAFEIRADVADGRLRIGLVHVLLVHRAYRRNDDQRQFRQTVDEALEAGDVQRVETVQAHRDIAAQRDIGAFDLKPFRLPGGKLN